MNWLKRSMKIDQEDTSDLVLVTWDADAYRQANRQDDLWFVCLEFQGQRCPFPFAVNLQDDDDDTLPDWLTEPVKKRARQIARSIGGRMSCYAIEGTPKEALEFTAFYYDGQV